MSDKLPPGAIPVEEFKADEATQAGQASAPLGAIPVDQFQSDEEKYTTPIEKFKAGVEGLERGMTLGASDLWRTKVEPEILPESWQTKPEDIAARMRMNPATSTAANILGGASVVAVTGGVGGFLPEAAGALANIGATAAEGGLFGAGNAVTDYALGDPDLNAQKVMSHIGWGALLGGGLGALGEGIRSFRVARAIKNAEKLESSGADIPPPSPPGGPGLPPVVDAPPELKSGVQTTTFQEMSDKVKNAQYNGTALELPQKAVAEEAASRLDMEYPVHPIQLDSLENQASRDHYQTIKEMPGEASAVFRGYESAQKKELNAIIDHTIDSVAPEKKILADPQHNGELASKVLTDQYEAEKKAAGELVKQAKSYQTEDYDHLTGVIKAMSDRVPFKQQMFSVKGGEWEIKPYDTSMGITKQTYGNIKEAFTALKKNPQDFDKLFNIREGLMNGVSITGADKTLSQVQQLKAGFMDYMRSLVDEKMPDLREAFKRYAINEEKRAVLEKNFGVQIKELKPYEVGKPEENITHKIFMNSETVSAAKEILPKADFDHITANYLAQNRAAATSTENVFSSKKFDAFLRKKEIVLREALADNPAALQKMKDATVLSRILPDSASINPSGTAKTLVNYLKNAHGVGDVGMGVARFIKDKTIGIVQHQAEMSAINEQLQGRAAKASILGELGKAVEKTSDKIRIGAKGIYSAAPAAAAIITHESPKAYDKHAKDIRKLSGDLHSMADHMGGITEAMYEAAPNITQGIHTAMASGVSFLESKLPKPGNMTVLAHEWEPSNAQKQRFNTYFQAVSDPISALKDVKQGLLSGDTMEALQIVHPHLLADMRRQVMESLDLKKAKALPYSVKISLSKFLGQPLDNALLPQVMAANQATFAMPSPSDAHPHSMPKSVKDMGGPELARTRTYRDTNQG